MTDAKFEILKLIHPAISPHAPTNIAVYCVAHADNMDEVNQNINELCQMGFIGCSGYEAWLTTAGIQAMEAEEQARTQRAEDLRLQKEAQEAEEIRAKKARRQQWISIGISFALSAAALIVSIISLLRS